MSKTAAAVQRRTEARLLVLEILLQLLLVDAGLDTAEAFARTTRAVTQSIRFARRDGGQFRWHLNRRLRDLDLTLALARETLAPRREAANAAKKNVRLVRS